MLPLRNVLASLVVAAACGGARAPDSAAAAAPDPPLAQDTAAVPAGYGTLRRDDIVVQFNTSQLQIQVLPLDDDIIRLLLPDTYQALTSLVTSKRDAIVTAAQRGGVVRPSLVLVTFRGLVPQARFSPEDFNIGNRGQLFRPVGVVPLSTAWDTYQLEAREQAMAIYLFPDGISFRERLLMAYEGLTNDSWSRTLSVVERERAAVRVRATTGTAPAPVPADTSPAP